VLLHYDKGMPLKAVTDKMGMSYINAKVTHKKALSGLRLAMGAEKSKIYRKEYTIRVFPSYQ